MMQTKYIIQMKMPSRPDLDYFYCGEGYDSWEEADRDARILQTCHNASGQTYTVDTVRQRI